MKKLAIAILAVVVILAAGIFYVGSRAGGLVRDGVVSYGPKALGAPVTLDAVDVDLLAGRAGLKGLVIGNPPGFKSAHALSLGAVRVALDTASVFSDKVIVERITIEAPEIIYEIGKGGSNIAALQRNAGAAVAALGVETGGTDETAGPALEIGAIDITGAKVTLAAAIFGGAGATVPLPDIHLEDIGTGDGGGASPAEVVGLAMSAISKAVAKAVSTGEARKLIEGLGIGDLGATSQEIKAKIKDKVDGDLKAKAKGKAAKTVKKLKGLFKKKKRKN